MNEREGSEGRDRRPVEPAQSSGVVPSDPVLCGAPKADGEPCETVVGQDGGRCVWHDPERKAEAREMRSRGAKAANAKRSARRVVDPADAPPRIQSDADCVAWSSWVALVVATGDMDARTGEAVIKAVREARSGLERLKLAEELEAVKADIEFLKRGGIKAS